jgi:glycosyltransferase involved in cell wall biosynthesis
LLTTLVAYAAQLDIAEYLTFTGAVSDATSAYGNATLFVLTSEVEGTPNVLLEAMACGVPIVATDVGGVRSILPDGWKHLCAPGDVRGMADSIVALLGDPAGCEALGAMLREHVCARHSLASLPGTLSELYSSVLST